MDLIGGIEDFSSGFLRLFCQTVMNSFQGEQPDPRMPMFCVIPGKEVLAEAPAVLNAAKTTREIRTVLEGLELRLGEQVVIARIRPAVGLGDSQVRQEQCHRFGSHRRAPVSMNGELTSFDILFCAGFFDELFGQRR